MEASNKLKALGYKEENINDACTLYVKNDKILVAIDGKDITDLSEEDATYLSICKCLNMRIIRIRNNHMKNMASYYIDENNNIFLADWAMSNRSYWMCLNDRTLYYYNKQSNFKCTIHIDAYQYDHLLMGIGRQGIVGNLIDDNYLLLGVYLIDLKDGIVTYVRSFKAYEKVACFGINSSSKLCNMFYSFEHKEFFKCTGVNYSLRNNDSDKNYIEYDGYRKRGEETYHVKIRSKEKGNTDFVKAIRIKEKNMVSMIKSNEGWKVNVSYQ